MVKFVSFFYLKMENEDAFGDWGLHGPQKIETCVRHRLEMPLTVEHYDAAA